MTDSKLFKKKSPKGETDDLLADSTTGPLGGSSESQVDQKVAPTAKREVMDFDNDEGTVRLSYDIPRRCHRALRVVSAYIECTILELLEELISKNLLGRDLDLIAADYYTARKVKAIKAK